MVLLIEELQKKFSVLQLKRSIFIAARITTFQTNIFNRKFQTKRKKIESQISVKQGSALSPK